MNKEYNFKCTTLPKYLEKLGCKGITFNLTTIAPDLKSAKIEIRKKYNVRILTEVK